MTGDQIRHVLTELTEEIMKVIRLGLSRCFGMFQEFDMLRGIWAFMHVEIFNIRMCKLDRGGASVYFFSIKDYSEQSNSFYITDFHSPSFLQTGVLKWKQFVVIFSCFYVSMCKSFGICVLGATAFSNFLLNKSCTFSNRTVAKFDQML